MAGNGIAVDPEAGIRYVFLSTKREPPVRFVSNGRFSLWVVNVLSCFDTPSFCL